VDGKILSKSAWVSIINGGQSEELEEFFESFNHPKGQEIYTSICKLNNEHIRNLWEKHKSEPEIILSADEKTYNSLLKVKRAFQRLPSKLERAEKNIAFRDMTLSYSQYLGKKLSIVRMKPEIT